jgi:hypothetical protein
MRVPSSTRPVAFSSPSGSAFADLHNTGSVSQQTLKRWIVRENYGDPLMQQCPSQPEVGDRVDGAMPYPR